MLRTGIIKPGICTGRTLRCRGWLRFFSILLIALPLLNPFSLRGEGEGAGARSLFNSLQDKAYRLIQKGEIRASIPYFKKMARLQPYNERIMYNYALSLLYQEKEKAESRADFERDCSIAAELLQKSIQLMEETGEKNHPLALRYFHLGMALWFLIVPVRQNAPLPEALPLTLEMARPCSIRLPFWKIWAVFHRWSLWRNDTGICGAKRTKARPLQTRNS